MVAIQDLVAAASSAYDANAASQVGSEGLYDSGSRSSGGGAGSGAVGVSTPDSPVDAKRVAGGLPAPTSEHDAFFSLLPYWLKQESQRVPPTVSTAPSTPSPTNHS